MPDTKSESMKNALAQAVRHHSAPNGFTAAFLREEHGAPTAKWQGQWLEFKFDVDGVMYTAKRRKTSRGDVAWWCIADVVST